MLSYGTSLNLNGWIAQHRESLLPPVGNQQIWTDSDLIVTVVGGPNQRCDFHGRSVRGVLPSAERGTRHLLIEDRGRFQRVELREGDVFPASPSRTPTRPNARSLAASVWSSSASARPACSTRFEWYCASCGSLVHRAECQLQSIVADLPKMFAAFNGSDESTRRCGGCGQLHPAADWEQWHRAGLGDAPHERRNDAPSKTPPPLLEFLVMVANPSSAPCHPPEIRRSLDWRTVDVPPRKMRAPSPSITRQRVTITRQVALAGTDEVNLAVASAQAALAAWADTPPDSARARILNRFFEVC